MVIRGTRSRRKHRLLELVVDDDGDNNEYHEQDGEANELLSPCLGLQWTTTTPAEGRGRRNVRCEMYNVNETLKFTCI